MEFEKIIGNKDIRKSISLECAKESIIMLELKREEKTLEDAFIKIVEDRPELSQKEREEIDKTMELEELRNEAKKKKELKAEKKKEKDAKKNDESEKASEDASNSENDVEKSEDIKEENDKEDTNSEEEDK